VQCHLNRHAFPTAMNDDKDLLARSYAEIRTRLDVRPPHPPIRLHPD
jgi:hypothetical protein